MQISFKLTRKGAMAAFGTRAVNDVVREAFRKAGEYWHTHFRPKHFTKAGAQEYGYAKRKNENVKRGSRRFQRLAGEAEKREGQILPLVHDGDLRAGTRHARIVAAATSNKSYAHVVMPGARGMNWLPPEMQDELGRISPRESTILARIINREILAGLKRLKASITKKIG